MLILQSWKVNIGNGRLRVFCFVLILTHWGAAYLLFKNSVCIIRRIKVGNRYSAPDSTKISCQFFPFLISKLTDGCQIDRRTTTQHHANPHLIVIIDLYPLPASRPPHRKCLRFSICIPSPPTFQGRQIRLGHTLGPDVDPDGILSQGSRRLGWAMQCVRRGLPLLASH